ncbi:MAG: ABC transporter ATP-binding protein [Acidobacteria bacterium]|nr:MAG: ABC transporter ATP-binding protein [Acidobacteriota bacterium]
MRLVSFALRHSRGIVIPAVLAGLVSGLSQTGLLALINTALTSEGPSSTSPLLPRFVALGLLMFVSRIISGLLLARLSQNATYHLRIQFSRRILETALRRLELIGTPKLMATFTEDIPALVGALSAIPTLCMHAAIVAGCLIYLGWLSWTLLLYLVPFFVLGVVVYQVAMAYAMRSLTLARQRHDSLLQDFRALTEGIKELKLHQRRRESFLARCLEPTAAALRRHNFRGTTIFTAAQSWGQLSGFVLIALVVLVFPSFISIGARPLMGFALVILYMLTPLEVMMSALPTLARANVAVRKIEELGISLAAHTTGGAAAAAPALSLNTLELSGVRHVYRREQEDGDFTLGPIDLTLHAGELVFLVGGNGSGKTTLAKLLTGLYVPETGEVRLNGQPITDRNRNFYRQHFSAVFSDFYLFESLLGMEAPGLDGLAREYLVKLQLDAKVSVEQGKLSTVELSQGQRKRLALLAAYLEDRPVYVFDEWAADQDPQFKEFFYLSLLPELKSRGKTAVVISHDDRFYHLADRLIKLDYGKLHAGPQPLSSPTAPITEVIR